MKNINENLSKIFDVEPIKEEELAPVVKKAKAPAKAPPKPPAKSTGKASAKASVNSDDENANETDDESIPVSSNTKTKSGSTKSKIVLSSDDEDEEQDEEQNEDDFEVEGILVDSMSMQYLTGATIDYKEDQYGSSFSINNPNAQTTCGCGSSFSV